jgi:fimbrial isopeptide formation D2 family protein/LPXTG-motif cell wall-anchored protein
MKKLVSRFMAVLMAMTMVLSMSMTVFATEAPKGTLTVNNTVAGKTLDLYQIFSATKSGENVAYTLNSEYEGFFKTKVENGSSLSGEALSDAAYNYVKTQVGTDGSNGAAFAKEIMKWILENTTTVETTHTTATTTAGTTVIDRLAYGYYVVYPLGATDTSTAPGNETVKSVASLVSVTGTDATVNMKSNYPTVDKKIIPAQSGSGITVGAIVDDTWAGVHHMELDDENESEDAIAPHGTTDEKKAGDFGIGDTVTYQLTSKVPDMTGYTSYTFKFTDTLSKGLDLKEVLSVKVGNTTLTAKKSGANTYALAYDKTNRILTVTLNDFYNSYKEHVGETITVVYTATLNKDAVIGMNPNTNKAELEFSNKPGTDETGKSEPSIVNAHTFDFTIFKYYLKDQKNQNDKTALAGAEFELYKANTEGTAADTNAKINIIDENNGVYRQATPEEASTAGFTSAKIVSDEDGKVLVKGLKAGTYYLKETKAPDGYNKLLSDIKIEIKAKYNDATGELESYSVIYTYNGNSTTVTNKDKATSPEVPVENKTGAQLPSTGSKGALMVTLAGIVLFGALTASKVFGKKKAKN